MATRSEEELAQHFVNYFSDQDLYFEVPAAGIIDIVVKSGPVITAIEVKNSFSFDVLEQAIKNTNYAHFSYIAVPWSKGRWFQERICKDYGVGLLVFEKCQYEKSGGVIIEKIKPRFNRRVVKIKLHDYQKRSVPGSQHKRITAFGHYVERLTQEVRRKPEGMTLKQLFESGFVHYSKISVFKACLADHIKRGVVKNIKLENGIVTYYKS